MRNYINVFLRWINNRYFFSSSVTVMVFHLHMQIAQQVLKLSSYVIGGHGFKKINLIASYPEVWNYVKTGYRGISIIGIFLMADLIYRNLFAHILQRGQTGTIEEDISIPPYPYDEDKLQLVIGLKHSRTSMEKVKDPIWIFVSEKGLYQNMLITGTIGTGKTASAMYPFVKQILFYKSHDSDLKPGMLILDVKGNFYKQVLKFAEEAGRTTDLVIIELGGDYYYNPMHKPNLKPLVLANRIKTVLTLFSGRNTNDSYWCDKAELLINECIKLCRLYNKGYVTFAEVNRLVNNRNYLEEKLEFLKAIEEQNGFSPQDYEEYQTACEYFDNEHCNLSENTLSIIQSVVTQMTQFFYTDPEVKATFCAPVEQLNFEGFRDVIDQGKIVILKMNIAQYRNLARTIAAYAKLDFQSEVMQRLVRDGANVARPVFLCADEYQEFVTATDAEFYGQSREARCCTIVATQSYTSLLNTLKDENTVRTITQNLINKIWLRTDDIKNTVREIQEQTGKEEKERISRSISENSGDVKKSRILGKLVSDKASISESVNISMQKEFIFDEKLITQQLDVFTGICFLSDGAKIIEPTVVHLQPYFSDIIQQGIRRKNEEQQHIGKEVRQDNDVSAGQSNGKGDEVVNIHPKTDGTEQNNRKGQISQEKEVDSVEVDQKNIQAVEAKGIDEFI